MLRYANEVFCNLLLSGLKMLWEAWRMKANEGEETQREVEEELARLVRVHCVKWHYDHEHCTGEDPHQV